MQREASGLLKLPSRLNTDEAVLQFLTTQLTLSRAVIAYSPRPGRLPTYLLHGYNSTDRAKLNKVLDGDVKLLGNKLAQYQA